MKLTDRQVNMLVEAEAMRFEEECQDLWAKAVRRLAQDTGWSEDEVGGMFGAIT